MRSGHLIRHCRISIRLYAAGFQRILIVCLTVSLLACSKNNESRHIESVICPQHKQIWFSESRRIFLNETNAEDIRQFAALLASWMAKTNAGCSTSYTNRRDSNQQLVEFEQETADKNLQTRQALWLVHQLTFLSKDCLFRQDKLNATDNPFVNKVASSLKGYLQQFPILDSNQIEIYAAENKDHILAYYRSAGNQRMFVVFNLSYDFTPVPFPFGFMASTKIKIWRTDDMQIREFVTKGELTLRPLTATVILVG